MSPFSMGAVDIPLKKHEISAARIIFDAISTFSNDVFENETHQDAAPVDDLIDAMMIRIEDGLDAATPFSSNAIACLKTHALEWASLLPTVPELDEGESGLRIIDAVSFSNSLVSGYIQTLQHLFDLPPIRYQYIASYQYIAMHEPLRPDVTVGYAVEVSKENVFFKSTADVLNKKDRQAQTFHDHIRFGRVEEAIAGIESGLNNLDEFDGRALKWAARNNQPRIFKALLDAGARHDYPDLEKLIQDSLEMKSALQAHKMEALIAIEKKKSVIRRNSL